MIMVFLVPSQSFSIPLKSIKNPLEIIFPIQTSDVLLSASFENSLIYLHHIEIWVLSTCVTIQILNQTISMEIYLLVSK